MREIFDTGDKVKVHPNTPEDCKECKYPCEGKIGEVTYVYSDGYSYGVRFGDRIEEDCDFSIEELELISE